MNVILQVADTGPLESLVYMFKAIGWKCYLPTRNLRNRLRALKLSTVLEIDSLVANMGYDRPMDLDVADERMLSEPGTVYVDVKAHINYEKVVAAFPNLRNRVFWYRINGGEPENIPGKGEELTPPCPVITPNQWYKKTLPDNSYTFWPYFYRFDDYCTPRSKQYTSPICLIHGINGWGYQNLIPNMQSLGIKFYGVGAPDGLIQHQHIPGMLSHTVAMVHLKSSDAPGYAIYEAMASACPLVCTKRIIWRCDMGDLLTDGVTCLTFDKHSRDPLTDQDIIECTNDVKRSLHRLADPIENRKIGEAGRERLKRIMWRRSEAGEFLAFLTKSLERSK